MRKLLVPALLGTALVTGLTTGCATLFEETVAASEIETQISAKLAGQLGGPPRSVDCPVDLRGIVGSEIRCELVTASGVDRVVNVKVTSVDGDTVNYDITAPARRPEPTPTGAPNTSTAPIVTRTQVEVEALRQLTPQLDGPPRSVTCPGDLRGEVGVTMECTLHFEDGTSRQITVSVTSVVNTRVFFDIRLGGADG
ncbi:DUF4333 domain-containing protein [Thermomonospora umbrina]|uniref:Uncharacterized protein DUF4333 n=1 Tax=Thermomonospora umbrina TaxID=111806 RepID=A0A3D9T8U7_9ACTN|nr:DUF4333 domain-containing protein [Thermomonospora umbrina]REF01085.1 uncharacterized protein DUF4333 [Thermomonospora umbrina]